MNKAERENWKRLAPDLMQVGVVHVKNRPSGGGAWYVCILQSAKSPARWWAAVTRHYKGPLGPPVAWNPKRTEIITDALSSKLEARRAAEGFALGRWARWAI